MSLFAPEHPTAIDLKQNRLMQLAALFLLLFSITLTFAPAVRLHSWEVLYRWNHWIGFSVWLICSSIVHRLLIRLAPDRDPYIFPVISLLCGWGLLTIWRLDSTMGARQTIWLAVSYLALTVGLLIPGLLEWLRRYKYFWLTMGIFLTGLTFFLGTYPGGEGPRLWLGCCGLYLQPSEPLKLLLIIYLAAYLADRIPLTFSLAQLLVPTLIISGTALALLIIQRDLGTASLFILIYTIVLYLASHRKRILIISLFILIGAGLGGYLLFDVVRIRVDAWLNPWLDPSGRSYQIVQSLLAVASGGLLGRGPGLGSPGVVPVAHSDFIFASITEEMGIFGAFALLGLFALLVGRGFRIALHAANNYQRYLAAGITSYLAVQAIFIMGGNLRLLPLTGVTLPYVSYGGSSLLTASISGLILILISNRTEEEPAPLARTIPYQLVSGGLLAGLLALAMAVAWWATVRSDSLLARTDNPRRGISDRYVQRGSLLDRFNVPIVRTTGESGEFQRIYEYPPLGPVTGYNSPLYGQAGLEAGLDDYLRGLQGNPYSSIFANHVLYGQPPPGVDIRLTLDLTIQKSVDELMSGHRGALVLIDAENGELLAVASHPYYNPNQLETDWQNLVQDPDAPLLNRATLGQYPPGSALAPFLAAYEKSDGLLADGSAWLADDLATLAAQCALEPPQPITPAGLITAGCPKINTILLSEIGTEATNQLLNSLGFYTIPNLPLEIAGVSNRVSQDTTSAPSITVSPLQMALAAAALTNQGIRPTPHIVSAIVTQQQEAQPGIQSSTPTETLLAPGAAQIINELSVSERPYWETTAIVESGSSSLTWYIGGTLPEITSRSLALALVIEENDPYLATEIGRRLFSSIVE